jgi:flagellar assembly protein FliH
MWCRLLTDGKTEEAQAIQWRQAGTPPGPESEPSAAPRQLYSEPPLVAGNPTEAALRDMERRVAEAHQRGLQEGEAAAAQHMAAQLNAKIEQLGRSIEQLALHRTKIQREAEPELVRLALAIARRILRRELTVDPESLLGLLKVGLEKIESADLHRIRVNPEHASILRKQLEGAARPVEVTAEPGLPVGSVIFETSRGSLDNGLETQLKEIERGFADLYPR